MTELRRERRIKRTMMWTDLGFLAYWVASAFGLISVGSEAILQDWNWSFLGLDLIAIGTGLGGLLLARLGRPASTTLMTISLALTSAAGLMALNFYALRCQFDPVWWAPNLWLFLFPMVALLLLSRSRQRRLAS